MYIFDLFIYFFVEVGRLFVCLIGGKVKYKHDSLYFYGFKYNVYSSFALFLDQLLREISGSHQCSPACLLFSRYTMIQSVWKLCQLAASLNQNI